MMYYISVAFYWHSVARCAAQSPKPKPANNKEAISKLGVFKSSGYQGYECEHEGFSRFLAQGDSEWFMTACELVHDH